MKRCGFSKRSAIGATVAATGSREVRSASTLVPACTGPTPEEPARVRCGGALLASLGSNRFWIAWIRFPTSPRTSARMKIRPAPPRLVVNSARRRQRERQHRAAHHVRRDAGAEQPLVDLVVGMRVVVAHDLAAGEGADRGAHHDVARPVLVIVHARQPDERRPAVHRGADEQPLLRPPARRLDRKSTRLNSSHLVISYAV